jgi:hypothetical protein
VSGGGDGGNALGKHGFAGAGWADHENVVPSGGAERFVEHAEDLTRLAAVQALRGTNAFCLECLQYAVGDPASCDGCHTTGCGNTGNGRAHSNLDGRWQSPKLQAAGKNPVSLRFTGQPRRLSPHRHLPGLSLHECIPNCPHFSVSAAEVRPVPFRNPGFVGVCG